ncbi:MAG: hypothetical protein PHC85_01320 [Candidatus Pacebacteria bacterium]|nr:hypothetical protein [Candidatus Paceibacterota bacterium]
MKPYLNLEYIFYRISVFFEESNRFFTTGEWKRFGSFSQVKIFSVVLSIILFFGILCVLLMLFRMRKTKLAELLKRTADFSPQERIERWNKVKRLRDSENPEDWKWAVVEADNIIDEIIIKIGYQGETFGERLSKIDHHKFKGIYDVWRAHEVRKNIDFEGEAYEFTQDEAKEVLSLYEKALKEVEYI